MRVLELVADLLAEPTPANPANLANGRATPSDQPLRTPCESCESAVPLRSHSQPFANPETRATPSDSQDSQHSQATSPQRTPATVTHKKGATLHPYPRRSGTERTPDAADLAVMRANLLAICRSHLLPERLAVDLPDADLAGCEELTPEGLAHFLLCRLEREGMQRGIAPAGWTQASYCARCGPVKLWADAPLHVIGCPWCHVRRAGGTVPRPAVTCSTCTHQQRRKDTSDAGMHGCDKGHELHHAHAPHVCSDWTPAP